MEAKDTVLKIHVEHSRPIEINEFTSALNAVGSLFSTFAQKNGDCKETAGAKLYVEKIQEGCIDVFLCEQIAAGLLPFAENINLIFEFAKNIKSITEYFFESKGEKPDLSAKECKDLHDMVGITAGDNNGRMEMSVTDRVSGGNVYVGCIINSIYANGLQNQMHNEIAGMKSDSEEHIYARQLMTIYQMRGDMGTDKGDKAVIDAISKNKLAVVFETDELKEQILHSDSNPTKKAFLVDVVVQTVAGRIAAYKVMALHDVIDID